MKFWLVEECYRKVKADHGLWIVVSWLGNKAINKLGRCIISGCLDSGRPSFQESLRALQSRLTSSIYREHPSSSAFLGLLSLRPRVPYTFVRLASHPSCCDVEQTSCFVTLRRANYSPTWYILTYSSNSHHVRRTRSARARLQA